MWGVKILVRGEGKKRMRRRHEEGLRIGGGRRRKESNGDGGEGGFWEAADEGWCVKEWHAGSRWKSTRECLSERRWKESNLRKREIPKEEWYFPNVTNYILYRTVNIKKKRKRKKENEMLTLHEYSDKKCIWRIFIESSSMLGYSPIMQPFAKECTRFIF